MPSIPHQMLLLWAVRKMVSDGFVPSGYDGSSNQGGHWNALPAPFPLAGIRPDAWGFHAKTSLVAFAEAKTLRDIDTAHTRRQLRLLGSVRMRNSAARCPLYMAVPHIGLPLLHYVLDGIGQLGAEHILTLGVPEPLLKVA